MSEVETLAIYGGTFSPPHLGHVHAAEAFYRSVSPDRLLIIPSAVPPHKAPVSGAGIEDRLAMCRLAFSHIPNTEISDMEIMRHGKSYTVETLRLLRAENRRIVMLVGTDMFLTLDTWYCAEEIFSLAEIAVIRREQDGETTRRLLKKADEYQNLYKARIRFIDAEPFEISSTALRSCIAEGRSVSRYLSKTVEEYIEKCQLYRA